MRTYLAEITGVAIMAGSPVTTVFRFSTSGYTSWATDTPANTYFEDRILGPVSVGRQLFGSNRVSGRSETSYGVLKLANIDGALEQEMFLLRTPAFYSFIGHPVRVYRGDSSGALSSFDQVFLGVCDGVRFEGDEVTFELKDNSNQLDVLFQSTVYLGNNTLPAGVEGVEDIKGKPKPWLRGQVFNITPVLVNTAKLIYQVNDGSISTVTVKDNGAATLTQGSGYSSQADMEANAPAAGGYRVWQAGGMFRLNAQPVGDITADVSTGSSEDLVVIMRKVVEKVVPSLTAFNTNLPSSGNAYGGIYIDTPTNALDVLDQLANSAGLWYYLDQAGTTFYAGYLEEPGSPAYTFDETDIASVSQIIPSDDTRGVPVSKVSMSYAKNYTIQATSTLAGSLTPEQKARLSTEYLTVEATGGANATQYPTAPVMSVESLIISLTDATSQSARLLNLHKVQRYMLKVLLFEAPSSLSLNETVLIKWPKLGLHDGGTSFRVIGIESGLDFDQTQLTLWG